MSSERFRTDGVRSTRTLPDHHAPADTLSGMRVRDFGAVHQRLNPGFRHRLPPRRQRSASCTFHNGNVIDRRNSVDCDDARRRLVYAILGREGIRHYNGSVQVLEDGEARSRMIWIIDVLPHEIAPYIASQMDLAVPAMQKTLGRKD